MDWIHNYKLFLFDFDGLLVNTEEIHYLAYQKMLKAHGIDLDWDFDRYCQAAHYGAHALRDQVYALYPSLKREEPDWTKLHAEKQRILSELFEKGAVHLMPGVANLIQTLHAHGVSSCVVTHSPDYLVKLVRKQHPVLDLIPFWVTREQYSNPKPSSECYLKAIEMYSKPSDPVIGFEDTPRGLTALLGTRATAVLICQAQYPEISSFIQAGALHYPTIESIKMQL